jgi:hypothetical protein
MILAVNLLPDYVSLLETRLALHVMQRSNSSFVSFLGLLGDFLVTTYVSGIASLAVFSFAGLSVSPMSEVNTISGVLNPVKTLVLLHAAGKAKVWFVVFPAFFASIWLWLYAGSGLILKAARRFDIGFEWFNRKFDIEKKPLQSIGLVAGALVAFTYWGVVVLRKAL